MTIKSVIQQYADTFKKIGHVDLTAQYILEFGSEYKIGHWDGPFGPMKACFNNAVTIGSGHKVKYYVEGYAIVPRVPFPVHHGWISNDGIHALEVTWKDYENVQYFGVKYPMNKAVRMMLRKGTSGLISPRDLMKTDPKWFHANWPPKDKKK